MEAVIANGVDSGIDDGFKLSRFFDESHSAILSIEASEAPSTDEDLRHRVSLAVRDLEWATLAVSRLDLFSSNERVEELPTSSLKFMLLPAYLAWLTNKKPLEGGAAGRKSLVEMAREYYEDFLRRLADYGAFEAPASVLRAGQEATDLRAMNADRESKIRRYREEKEREQRLAATEERRKLERLDEEDERGYWLEVVEKWAHRAVDELKSLKEEGEILAFMERRSAGIADDEEEKSRKAETERRIKNNPFAGKPFILTRNDFQKQVFGLGYPSVPTMTVEEWYDQQAAQGLLPTPEQSRAQMNEAMAANDPLRRDEEEERKKEEDERKEENDDEAERSKKIEWDDWKDDHRRGWGNRKNMG